MAKLFNITSSPGKGNVQSLLEIAKNFLLNDQIIAIPTDTIYGLAVNADSQRAIQRLYSVKERNFNKAFAICVAEIEDISRYSEVTVPDDLLRELLPGAVTVMFQRGRLLNACLNPDHDLVGIRVPDYPFIQNLCALLKGPIALTSANLSSKSSCLNVEEFKVLWPSLGAVFNGGQLGEIDPERMGSTIIDLSTVGHFRIVRSGCVLEKTLHVLEKYGLTRLL